MTMKTALTIAGSDTSGGAGLQADLKTFQELGVFGMTAITTIVTMSPKDWSHTAFPIDMDTLKSQIETILSAPIDAMKTGMLGSVEIIEFVAGLIDENKWEKVVIDPVLVCKGENDVLHPETAEALREILVPRALVTTPNLFEAAQLAKVGPITSIDEMKEAATKIHESGAKNVVIKGGSRLGLDKAIDLFYDGKEYRILENELIPTTYTHGAGCTFAAAITAELAKGKNATEAVETAKSFISAAINHGFKLNQHVGPTMPGAYRLYGSK